MMNPVLDVEMLSARVVDAREREALARSFTDHLRNGRGFWPVVTIDGHPQVVRFSSDVPQGWVHERWQPETGAIDLVPLYALPVADWPRVCLNRQ